ncbi:MAG: L-alanine exporter AlaE [Nanoarchaeota archaeon]|nr:L-alanine exporter AlaE [Nanoarchaeota archaeon]
MKNLENIIQNVKERIQNWAIDTSAKVLAYAPLMGAMEAYNGLGGEQILKSRTAAALIDTGVARIYTKTADYLSKKFDVDIENGGFKGWLLDTVAMVGVYTPVYAAILKASGADNQQTTSALLMGAGIAAVTSRPFRKYALIPWRKLWNYKTDKK